MVLYPNNSFVSRSDSKTNNKENFIKCYNEIFDKNIISSILNSKIEENNINAKKSTFQAINNGDMEYLILAYSGILEYGFYFTKINGKILLFKAEFLGDTD